MSALEELLAQWRNNPDADATVALCSFLGVSSREDLVREVGASAETWHAEDSAVMLAVGRMYLDASLLAEAQAALVTAGKVGGRDPKPFRFLGEVLLRRGDAARAEKVLARAIQLGAEEDSKTWHERAVFYTALQKRVGAEAVAAEVARTMPKQNSIPPPALAPSSRRFGNEEVTKPRAQNPLAAAEVRLAAGGALPRFDSAEAVRVSDTDLLDDSRPKPSPALRAARATAIGIAPPPSRMPVNPPQRAPRAPAQSSYGNDDPTKVGAAPRFDDVVTTVTPAPFLQQAAPAVTGPLPAPPFPGPRAPSRPPLPLRMPSVPVPPISNGAAAALPVTSALPAETPFDALNPEPQLVLAHLSRVGVYEPGGGAPPAWETPTRQKARGTWTLSVAIVLIGAAGIGSFQYSKKIRAERMAHAAALTTEVDKLLHTGSVGDLKASDQKLNSVFELDSLSPRAARLWLENRVLYALLTSEEARGIDAAVHRGRTVELPEKDLVFGKIASFMMEGDLAGGAALLPRWDKDASDDAFYQLSAGAVLERAGDLRAIERYDAARRADPQLVPAEMLLARLLLLEFGNERARPVIESLKAKLGGEHPVIRALTALAWVVDSERPDALPSEAKLEPADVDKLPAPLRAVPAMIEAAVAMRAGDMQKASLALDSAIGSATTPSLATGLGFLAIEAGNEQLARKAALRALQFAAIYPRARTLAARVALLGGRLDEAQKAIEELDPRSPDVAVVRGVVAYETLEAGDLDGVVKSLGDAATHASYSALAAGPPILLGRGYPPAAKLESMAEPTVAWGELIAADAALDTGNLALAQKILGRRQGEQLRPVHYLRLARLYRYQGKPDEAVKAAAEAREGAITAAVLIESVYDFLKKEDSGAARDLLARYPTVLGPMSGWLAAMIDVTAKQKAQADARISKLDPPPPESPLLFRALVARSLALAGDKRARPYVLMQVKLAPKGQPELLLAATDL